MPQLRSCLEILQKCACRGNPRALPGAGAKGAASPRWVIVLLGDTNNVASRANYLGGDMAKQITCINKIDRNNPYERITHVGGTWGKITQQDAIRQIESRTESFYVSVRGHSVWVVVAVSRFG